MKKPAVSFRAVLYLFCYFLFQFASDMTHIEGGSELSLWLMTFAVVLTISATLFAWLGIRWLAPNWKGSKNVQWLAYTVQFLSWGTFGYAIILRWGRNIESFHWWITVTALLWSLWMLILVYNRYAARTGVTLNKEE